MALEQFIGQQVVIDTDCTLVYVGTLEAVSGGFLTLTEADVHDMGDSNTTKERYVLESRRFGVRKNREQVLVVRSRLVSLSRLEDVIAF